MAKKCRLVFFRQIIVFGQKIEQHENNSGKQANGFTPSWPVTSKFTSSGLDIPCNDMADGMEIEEQSEFNKDNYNPPDCKTNS